MVMRLLGKEEIVGSIPTMGSTLTWPNGKAPVL